MLDNGVPRARLVGSWAGATGYPQFLPSVYLRVARDGNGDGKIDIWTSEADALASIANYFVDEGWRKDVPWCVPVAVPSNLDRNAIMNRTNRSEEHTSELQSIMRISYAVFCMKKNTNKSTKRCEKLEAI